MPSSYDGLVILGGKSRHLRATLLQVGEGRQAGRLACPGKDRHVGRLAAAAGTPRPTYRSICFA